MEDRFRWQMNWFVRSDCNQQKNVDCDAQIQFWTTFYPTVQGRFYWSPSSEVSMYIIVCGFWVAGTCVRLNVVLIATFGSTSSDCLQIKFTIVEKKASSTQMQQKMHGLVSIDIVMFRQLVPSRRFWIINIDRKRQFQLIVPRMSDPWIQFAW